MGVQITIDGLDRVMSMLDPARLARAIDDGVQASAQMLRDQTKLMPPVSGPRDGYDAQGIPVDTGRMRQSIVAQKTALFGAMVSAPVDYSGYVHDGKAGVPARPFFLWELEDFGGLEQIRVIMNDALERALTP
jgi:hypothetical protein